MVYATPSDRLLSLSLYSGLAVFLLTLLLLLSIVLLRQAGNRRERRQQGLFERWQPVFIHAAEDLPVVLPKPGRRERQSVLFLWIHFTEALRGTAHPRLRQLALDLGLERTALELLQRREVRLQLMAVVALGRMQSRAAWEWLTSHLDDPNPILSLLAARSLLQIDFRHAGPPVLAAVARRNDWPFAKISAMLREIPTNYLAVFVVDALRQAAPPSLPRLIGLLDGTHWGDVANVIQPYLETDQPTDVIAAALRVCRHPHTLDAVRRLATHEHWVVRARAAETLGKIGVEQDRFRLQAMLGDPEWWVRYRAGMALARMPFVPRQKLEAMIDQLKDHFAADILRQVLAETAPENPS